MIERAIATASDANYFVGLCVMLNSVHAQAPDLPVFIFNCGLTKTQINYLQSAGYNIVIPNQLYGPTWGHVTSAVYARFSCCNLPVKKVLYLDPDLIVVGSLNDIFKYDCPLGVCREDGMQVWTNFYGKEAIVSYGIDEAKQSFNGGVLLINVEYWGERFYEEYLNKTRKWGYDFKFADQSCLHLIAFEKGEFEFIPKKWNTFHYELEKYPDFRIIHYHMSKKPWHKDFPACPALELWKQYS